jgi:excinuclease UvrABC nuclease subunit
MRNRWPLVSSLVRDVPEEPGVYALWENAELIYVAKATDLRHALTDHLLRTDPCTRTATHYAWEIALDPTDRERRLLALKAS